MIKIFIADDHALIREGFKKLISNEIDMSVEGEAENASEVMEFIAKNKYDIIVLDISMPGRSGLDLMKDLRNITPDTKVLIFTMHSEDHFAIRALKAGAAGYLTKMSASKELVKAIRKIASGGKYVSSSLAEKLAFTLNKDGQKLSHEYLSDREFEVFYLIGSGKTIAEISDKLSISTSTVNTYRQRILKKMDMKTTADIIYYVVEHNLR